MQTSGLLGNPLKDLQNWEFCQWPEACGKDAGNPGGKQVIASQPGEGGPVWQVFTHMGDTSHCSNAGSV